MMRFFACICIIAFYSNNLAAQKHKTNLRPISQPNITAETPEWARLMYAPAPNVHEVDKLFNAYYSTHAYEKTLDTRNYKHWRRYLTLHDCVQDDGTIQIPTAEEAESKVQDWLSQNEMLKTASGGTAERGPSSAWTQIGPFEGVGASATAQSQTSCMVAFNQCLGNLNVLYAVTQNGKIFKTIDHGSNWFAVGENYFFEGDTWTEQCITVHPTNPDIVYYGSGSKIWKTTDGGITWVTLTTISNLQPNTIIINPIDPNMIYVASDLNLYKSINAGLTFTIARPGKCWDVRFKTDDPNTLFAICRNGTKSDFYKSIDGGTVWNASLNGWFALPQDTDNGGRMTVSTGNPNLIYCFIIGKVTGDLTLEKHIVGVAVSTNAGVSWTQKITHLDRKGIDAGQGYYDLDIEVSDANDTLVLIGTQGTWKTTNGFTTVTSGPSGQHADPQEYHFNGPNDFWVASDGGIDLYANDLSSRVSRSYGITGIEFWGFDQGWNEDTRIGSYYHNGVSGYRTSFPDNKWRTFAGGEPASGYLSVRNPSKGWASGPGGVFIPETLTGSYSTFSYNKLPNEAYWSQGSRSEIVTHPQYSDTHFLGKDNVLWKTTDGGGSFTALYTFGTDITHLVTSIEVSRANPNVILVYQYRPSANGSLYKSIDGGLTFSTLALPAGNGASRGCFITTDPLNQNIFWIAYNTTSTSTSKVFKTVDGGTTWTNMTGLLSSSSFGGIRAILHIGGTNGGVYAMTRHTMLYRNNTHSDWQSFGTGLSPKMDNNYLRPFYKEGQLRMATISRGLWSVDFYEAPTALVAQPIVDKMTSNCTRDTFYFEDFSMLKHAGATWQWSFSPSPQYVSSATSRNPKVVFGASGNYSVTLTVTDANGATGTKTVTDMVQLSPVNLCSFNGGPDFAGNVAGTIDYFQTTKALPIGNTNTITIACWVKPNGIQAVNAGIAFTNAGSGGSGFNFRSNNQLGYHWNESASAYNWGGGPTLPSDVWSHIALVIEPTRATIYLNGVASIRTGSVNHPAVDFVNAFWIGNDRGNTGRTMNGSIDELRFYKRALTQSEIRDLRHLTYPSYASNDADLVAYYKFNEPSGLVYDRIGDAHASANGLASTRSVHTGPFQIGKTQRLNITTAGPKNFNLVDVEMVWAAGATLPNGDVAISRLDSMPIAPFNVLPTIGNRYWVLNNYGTNAVFTSPTSMTFSNIPVTLNIPDRYKLYLRTSNGHIVTGWQLIDVADAITVGPNGSITFTGLNLPNFGQLAIFDQIGELPSVALTNTFIQGYMDGTAMRPTLQLSGIAGATLSQTDTITVSIHQATSPYALVQSYRGVLNTNGTISAYFTPAVGNIPYYIVVKGRNIIETWSVDPVLLVPGATYAFSSAYGGNLGSVGGIPVIYSGDMNENPDGVIDLVDYPLWETDYNNFSTGYFRTDLNGDGVVDLVDYPIWEENYNNFITVIKP
jgi:hypothetical protein